MCGNRCFYFCADDTHGTPIMISARNAGITPEQFIARIHKEHTADFAGFHVAFDNYYTTHSPENKTLSELIFNRLNDAGSIVKRPVGQTYCETDKMPLPDRYVRGTCPRCGAVDQYGDSCESLRGDVPDDRSGPASLFPVRDAARLPGRRSITSSSWPTTRSSSRTCSPPGTPRSRSRTSSTNGSRPA